MLVVQRLAGVLLDDALDADPFVSDLAAVGPVVDLDLALADEGVVVLADLVALRQGRDRSSSSGRTPTRLIFASAPCRCAPPGGRIPCWAPEACPAWPRRSARPACWARRRTRSTRRRRAWRCEVTCAWTSRPITTSHSPGAALDRDRSARRLRRPSPPRPAACGEPRPLLDRQPRVEHPLLVERLADDLQAERQALAVEARPAPTWRAGRRGSPAPRTRRSGTWRSGRWTCRRARRRRWARSGSAAGRLLEPRSKSRAISARTFCAWLK